MMVYWSLFVKSATSSSLRNLGIACGVQLNGDLAGARAHAP
eukprot:COSAG03_NODE_115_length_12417_cov_9.898945_3_plen_41_part_00